MLVEIEIHKKAGDFHLDMEFQSDSKRIGILGASGCGKSMTLRSIAGVEEIDSGRIVIDGKVVYDSNAKINWKPQKRNIGYLFQNYALFPSMTVKENIAVGIKKGKKEKELRVQEMVRKFQLEGLENHYPSELSGGQQQRVALARVMAYEPDMILLDEPFSALDMFLKDHLQQELMELLSDYEGVVILVSHSRDEIYRFSEELLIMDAGQKLCSGTVKEVFQYPKNVKAAQLTGCKNIAAAEKRSNRSLYVPDWGIELVFSEQITEPVSHVGIRAHDFIPVWGEWNQNCLKVEVNSVAELPFEKNYYLKTNGDANDLCWFVQRNQVEELEQKGLPDYLQIPEEAILLLKEK